MRFTIAIAAIALLLIPAAQASPGTTDVAKAQSTDFSAAKKKKARRGKAEKVEYMRAVPAK
jgi:hypothetical protein